MSRSAVRVFEHVVESEQLRVGRSVSSPTDSHLRQLAKEAVLQDDSRIPCNAHSTHTIREAVLDQCLPVIQSCSVKS